MRKRSRRPELSFAKYLLPAFALLIASPSFAQEDAPPAPSEMPERISFLVAFGDEKCREPAGDEIVVCANVPENERYRIPVALRKKERVVTDRSWSSAVETLDSFAADVRPNSCSVNGSNGFTGCTQKLLQTWFAERRGKLRAN
jgi:hypothetical protein